MPGEGTLDLYIIEPVPLAFGSFALLRGLGKVVRRRVFCYACPAI
jgi:hypothetical protein